MEAMLCGHAMEHGHTTWPVLIFSVLNFNHCMQLLKFKSETILTNTPSFSFCSCINKPLP